MLYGTLALAACAVLTLAKGKPGGKPGGGGGDPTGVIYFTLAGQIHTMDPDGSSKTALPSNVGGEPSRDLHGGHRWFLQVRSTSDGPQLFAVRDDGNETLTVQLTTNAVLRVSELPVSARWGVGDAEVSWIAQRTDIAEGGIYAAGVVFDGGGNVAGLSNQPTSPLVEGSIITRNARDRPNIRSHDWSPDGNEIVYDTLQSNGNIESVTIVDLVAGASTDIDAGMGPVWSPDGGKIASGGGSIATINPDGTGKRVIQRGHTSPRWSPSGEHLICVNVAMVLDDERQDVIRTNPKGGGRANLTADLDTRTLNGTPAGVGAWR
ncbi:MAG: TolB family protein [Planctomycetota bacterium]|jgi:hypothetical protein